MTARPRPLTSAQSVDFAHRWSCWNAYAWPTPPDGLDEDDLDRWLDLQGIAERPLTDRERERLYAWVRDHESILALADALDVTIGTATALWIAAKAGPS